ncbi:hypothetical protein D3C75_1097380 [compost metagenome]
MLISRRTAHGGFITHRPRPRQIRDIGGIHSKGLLSAILFIHLNIQPAADGTVQVPDTKRPRGNGRFINHPSLLRNRHRGVGFGNTTDFRGITTQVRRQHAFIARQTHPGKTE